MIILQIGGVSLGEGVHVGGGVGGERGHFRQIQTNGWRVAIATADSQLAE